jgi:hypothetical protein
MNQNVYMLIDSFEMAGSDDQMLVYCEIFLNDRYFTIHGMKFFQLSFPNLGIEELCIEASTSLIVGGGTKNLTDYLGRLNHSGLEDFRQQLESIRTNFEPVEVPMDWFLELVKKTWEDSYR